MGQVTQADGINVVTGSFLIVFKICGSFRSNNLTFYQNYLIKNPILFCKYLSPKSCTKKVLYSEFAYGSHFSEEKNDLKIRYLVAEILSKLGGGTPPSLNPGLKGRAQTSKAL